MDSASEACEGCRDEDQQAMKEQSTISGIVLQNCQTKMLLSKENRWSNDPTEAQSFQDGASAVAYALNHSILNAQILLQTPDERQMTVPISCP
jgi:hypothetical protein